MNEWINNLVTWLITLSHRLLNPDLFKNHNWMDSHTMSNHNYDLEILFSYKLYYYQPNNSIINLIVMQGFKMIWKKYFRPHMHIRQPFSAVP